MYLFFLIETFSRYLGEKDFSISFWPPLAATLKTISDFFVVVRFNYKQWKLHLSFRKLEKLN
jgi:hypothetical protein